MTAPLTDAERQARRIRDLESLLDDCRALAESDRIRLLAMIGGHLGETFIAGATFRLCIDCQNITVGGPTRCTGCVRAMELRARAEAAEARQQELAKLARRRHPAISCASRGFFDETETVPACDCGADEHNAKVDALLGEVRL